MPSAICVLTQMQTANAIEIELRLDPGLRRGALNSR